jgi:hypothetical protein
MKSNSCFCIWLSAFLLIPGSVYGQIDSTSAAHIQKTDDVSKKVPPHSFYTSLGFGNNMVVASTVTTAQPYYYGSLIYGFNSKFFISASTFHLPGFEPFLAYSAFGANYSHTFSSWFDISAGAYRYQVSNELTDTLFSSFFYGDITLGIDWRLIYSRISFGSIFSETSRGYLQFKNSRYFQTPEFSRKKAFISFDPYINLVMGSMTKTTTNGETVIGIDSPIRGSGSGTGSGSGSGSGSGTSPTTTTSTFFGPMEVDFGLPVGFNSGNITFEIEPGYVLPMYTDPEISSPEGFTFIINCFIKIF